MYKYSAAKWERDRRRKEEWNKKLKAAKKKRTKYYAKAKKFWDKEEFSPPVYIGGLPYSDTERKQLAQQKRLIKKWKKSKKPKKKKQKKGRNYKGLTYSQLLLTPEWRKRREEILLRDNRTCQKCGFKIHLEVHHKKYGYKYPWMSPDKDLITLCVLCHAKEHGKL